MSEPARMALLMIRTWREEGSELPFRAQVRTATDRSSGFVSTVNVAGREQVVELVRTFLGGSQRESTRID